MLTKLGMVLGTTLLGLCSPPNDQLKPVEGRCPQYEPLLEMIQPENGWDVSRMSRIMWRESRCTTNIRSQTSDTGLLQINDINHPWLGTQWGTQVTWSHLTNPILNILAAANLYDYWSDGIGNGYQPWKLTTQQENP